MACGEMGLHITYLYTLTPRQFYNIQKGYFKKQERLLEDEWLRLKTLSYFVYSGIPKKKGKQKTFTDFVDTFFNTKEQFKPVSNEVDSKQKREQMRQFFKKLDTQNGKPQSN